MENNHDPTRRQRDGLMTERGNRASTFSPANPENERRISALNQPNLNQNIPWNQEEEPYIKKWVDFAHKYGVGYLLSNDCVGAYFNDNSKILLHCDCYRIDYFEKAPDKQEKSSSFNI